MNYANRLFFYLKSVRSLLLVLKSRVEGHWNDVDPITLENKPGWSSKFNVGFYQTYKISKNLSEHAIIMYDVLKIKKFPASKNGGALRFGFDYQIKKKNRKQ